MDRREAVFYIKELQKTYASMDKKVAEALDLAIEALEGDLHCPKCGTIVRDGRQYHDLVYRGEAEPIKGDAESVTTNLYDVQLAKDLLGISEEAEKVQLSEETSTTSKTETVDTPTNTPTDDDTISRQAAIDAVCGDFRTLFRVGGREEVEEILKSLPPSERESEVDYCNNCPYISWGGDCISRQTAIEAIEGVDWYHVNSKGELVSGSTSDEESWYKAEDIYEALESLKPITPPGKVVAEIKVDTEELIERIKEEYQLERAGNWIIEKRDPQDVYMHAYCSECDGYWSSPTLVDSFYYCPNCGAKMER